MKPFSPVAIVPKQTAGRLRAIKHGGFLALIPIDGFKHHSALEHLGLDVARVFLPVRRIANIEFRFAAQAQGLGSSGRAGFRVDGWCFV